MPSQPDLDTTVGAEAPQIILGDIRYRVIRDFGILPPSVVSAEVSQIAVDSRSRVHVARRGAGVPVVVYEADGTFTHAYAHGLMFDAHGITIDRYDRVFIVDRDAHQVLCFDRDGTFRFAFGDRHRPHWNAPFNHPTKVGVADDGEIYVADGYGNGCVHRFDPEGRYRSSFGAIGHGPGCFLTPHAVLVDKQDRVVVCDRENHRVQIFDREGAWLSTWDGLSLPMDCCEMPDGAILVTDQVPSVSVFAPDGRRLGRGRPSLNGAHGLARDLSGSVYLAELRPNGITKLEPIVDPGGDIAHAGN